MCVFLVIAYLVTRTKYFTRILEHQFSKKNILIFILIFGIITIFFVISGIDIFDNEADMAQLAPMVAGLLGGPLIGLGVGLIGGISHYLVGSADNLIISILIVFSGIFAGIINWLNHKKFIGMKGAVLFSLLMGSITILTVVLFYDYPLNYIIFIGSSLVISNTLGILLFSFIISNLINERETSQERDKFLEELEREKNELLIARNIQKSFLPKRKPIIKNFDVDALTIPAREVGGDFYDFIPISGEKMGLVIADVSGKSVPAALFMAFSRTVIHSKASENPEISSTVRDINKLITEDAESGMFVTLFYSVVDFTEKTFTYVNAGHNPPLLYKAKTGEIESLKTEGMAIGVLEEVKFEEKEVLMETNDMVILYTDGVTEAVNESDEQFGEKGLLKLLNENNKLTASDMIIKIKEEVSEFSKKQEQFDDITLMVVKAR